MSALASLLRSIEMRIERQRKILAQSEAELASVKDLDERQRKLALHDDRAAKPRV